MTILERGVDSYTAFSRPNALRQAMSWRQFALGRLLRKLPPRLAAVRFDNFVVRASGDSGLIRADFVSPIMGVYRLSGSIRRDTLSAELRTDSLGPPVGHVRATRDSSSQPVRQYQTLADAIRDTMAAYVFDPRLMRTSAWAGFFAELATRLGQARDDADAMVAFYALRDRLKTSHVQLAHDRRLAAMSVDSALAQVVAPPESLVTLSFPAPGVAHLYIRRWHQVSKAVDRAFSNIEAARAQVLILDIRGNPGGDQSSLSPAAHLLPESTYVGVLLANRWYLDHSSPPTSADLPSLPTTSQDNLLTTFRMLRERGVAVGLVTPRAPRFTGKVFLVVDRGSGSASEPLAYLLRHSGRATLVGEHTPGGMLAAVPHPVGDGWVLLVPEGDYYTADGVRLEGRGVAPDVSTPSMDALLVIADSLRTKSPYAGALLSARNYLWGLNPARRAERLGRSESWARQALRLEPDSIAPIDALSTALAAAQRWEVGFAIWDSLLARRPHNAAALYQIGRFAALSGTHLDAGERALHEYVRLPLQQGLATPGTAYWRLGTIAERKGDRPRALASYNTGLTLEPDNLNLLVAVQKLHRSP